MHNIQGPAAFLKPKMNNKNNTQNLKHTGDKVFNKRGIYFLESMQLYRCRCELQWSWWIPSSRPVLVAKPWSVSGSCKHYRYLLCTAPSGLTCGCKNTIKTMKQTTDRFVHKCTNYIRNWRGNLAGDTTERQFNSQRRNPFILIRRNLW